MTHVRTVLLIVLTLTALSTTGLAQQDYKEYVVSRVQQDYFSISFDKHDVVVRTSLDSRVVLLEFAKKEVRHQNGQLLLHGRVLFDEVGLHISDTILPYDLITDSRVVKRDGMIVIEFFTGDEQSQRIQRLRRGNRIEPARNVVVTERDFIRGMIFSVSGDVNVAGEVGRDIISLAGDIRIDKSAVVRGDAVSVFGEVTAERNATVYGELYSGKSGVRISSPRFQRRAENTIYGMSMNYNRVDGLRLSGNLGYEPDDPYLPAVKGEFGYAFASKRTRWDLSLTQAIIAGRHPLKTEISYFRKLANDDEWLISELENLPFVLLVTEDFKDYYESEGGLIAVSWTPVENLTGTLGYRYETTRWFPAKANLWSLFGGDKTFRRNFYWIDEPLHSEGITALDTSDNASVLFSIDYDTRDHISPYEASAWQASFDLEWSSPDFESNFDFRRYSMNLCRHQAVTSHTMLLLRARYSGSDGILPMHKRFFLGGLGTLHGYDHKEYYGTRLWMLNAEYRFKIPGSEIALSTLYDAGKIANDAKLDGDIELKQSAGVAVTLAEALKFSLSKRLDRGEDDALQFWVRIRHIF
jgi:hypothetical protein